MDDDGIGISLICEGIGASDGEAEAECHIVEGYDPEFPTGFILVAPRTDPEMTPNLIMASGVITDQGGMLCHAAIVAREIGIPCVVGVQIATHELKKGQRVRIVVRHGKGEVYSISP